MGNLAIRSESDVWDQILSKTENRRKQAGENRRDRQEESWDGSHNGRKIVCPHSKWSGFQSITSTLIIMGKLLNVSELACILSILLWATKEFGQEFNKASSNEKNEADNSNLPTELCGLCEVMYGNRFLSDYVPYVLLLWGLILDQ